MRAQIGRAGAPSPPVMSAALEDPVDLDGIERELADVEVALARLEDGTYWTHELTGDPLPDTLLEEHPAARRQDQ